MIDQTCDHKAVCASHSFALQQQTKQEQSYPHKYKQIRINANKINQIKIYKNE